MEKFCDLILASQKEGIENRKRIIQDNKCLLDLIDYVYNLIKEK